MHTPVLPCTQATCSLGWNEQTCGLFLFYLSISQTSPRVSLFRNTYGRYSRHVPPFTTLNNLRYTGAVLLNYFLRINQGLGTREGNMSAPTEASAKEHSQQSPLVPVRHRPHSGLAPGEGSPGHRTAHTLVSWVLPRLWLIQVPFLLASSPSPAGTREAHRKQAPLLHLWDKTATGPLWDYCPGQTGWSTGPAGRILAPQMQPMHAGSPREPKRPGPDPPQTPRKWSCRVPWF